MKALSLLILSLALILCGCGAGSTEQTRTTVSDYNILAGTGNSNLQSNSTNGTPISSNSSESILGTWKLASSSGGYPHAVGSTLTISGSTFALTQPSASGNYSIQGSTFSFDFGGGLIIRFTYTLSGSTLNFTGIDYAMNMSYTKN